MKKMLKRLIIAVLFLCAGRTAQAQLDTSDFSFQVAFKADQASISSEDTLFFHRIDLRLEDTLDVEKIRVKIGTSMGASDIEDYEFIFDNTTFLPLGYAFYREADLLHLTLNKHTYGTYYFEVNLVDKNGNSTLPRKWNN